MPDEEPRPLGAADWAQSIQRGQQQVPVQIALVQRTCTNVGCRVLTYVGDLLCPACGGVST